MAYLSQPTSTTEFGVVTVGDYINVADGVIFLDQDVSPTASVTFASANVTGSLFLDGDSVITSVTPSVGLGISLTDLISSGPNVSFKLENTGVLSLIAGTGISISGSTGDITISATGTQNINTVLVTSGTYNVLAIDQYIGVSSTSPVTIQLPAGFAGRTYSIKDEYGQGSGKITVKGAGSELVDKSASYIISVPFRSITVVFRGGNWRVI